MAVVLFILLLLSLPIGIILGIASAIHYSTCKAKEDRLALAGCATGLVALTAFWSSKIFIPYRSFLPGGVEGCIDLDMYIAGVAFSVIAIWLLFRSRRPLACAFGVPLLIILSITYAGAMLETYG